MQKTYFASLFSSVTLGVLLVTPAFAEMPTDPNSRELILSCRQEALVNYRSSLQESLQDLRSTLRNQWRRQVDFRVRAARPAQRASVTNALRTAETQLETAINQFEATQRNSIDADTNTTVNIFATLDGDREAASLEQWSNRNVSFQVLDTALARSERTLRTYASTRDRAIITQVWNDTRRQVENTFSQARNEARGAFVDDVSLCLNGGDFSDTMTDEPQTDANNTQNTNNTSETAPFAVQSVKVDSVHDLLSACSQRITFRGQVQTNRPGQVRGYFQYPDGQRSDNVGVDTNGNGFAMFQDTKVYTASNNSPVTGNVKFIVTNPNRMESDNFSLNVRCDASASQNTQAAARAEATNVSVQGPSTIRTCGTYPFTFVGTINYAAVGTVQYYWLGSDGSRSPNYSVYFGTPGTKTVSYEWRLSGNQNQNMQIVIVSPNTSYSPKADFSLMQNTTCAGQNMNNTNNNTNNNQVQGRAEAGVTVRGPSAITTCGNYPFSFEGVITANAAVPVTYYWLRSDGQRSPNSTVNFTGPGSRLVTYDWPVGSNFSGFVQLVIVSPNDSASQQASFSYTQAPACAGQNTNNTNNNTNNTNNTNNNNESSARAEASIAVQGPSSIRACGVYPVSFQGTISYNGVGNVSYYWMRSDRSRTPSATLNFQGAGTRVVNYEWSTQGSNNGFSGWVQLVIESPNAASSPQANFTIVSPCGANGQLPDNNTNTDTSSNNTSNNTADNSPAVTLVTASLDSQANITTCGPSATFNFKGTITTSRAGEVRYRWERSDGVLSPTQTLTFDAAGSRTVNDAWTPGAISLNGYERLHVIAPNDMLSGTANFTLTQSCN